MKNKLFATALLFTCLAPSVAWAKYEEDNDFWYNTRVAIDFGFGLPYGYALKDTVKDKYKIGNEAADVHFSPNIHVGILGSHDFNITDKFSMGPEIGVCYGFTRRYEIKNLGISMAEKYIILPLYLRMTSYSEPDAFLVSIAKHLLLGYNQEIIKNIY